MSVYFYKNIWSVVAFGALLLLVACAPNIKKVTPTSVDADGGTDVVVSGKHFNKAKIYVDDASVSAKSQSDEKIVFTSPEHDPGAASITIKNKYGEASFSGLVYIKEPKQKYII